MPKNSSMYEEIDVTESREASVAWNDLRQAAIQLLAARDFRLTSENSGQIEFRGPGMRSSRQPAIVGASFIRVTQSYSKVTVEATLGGAKWMGKFIRYFPMALGLGLDLILSIVFLLVLPSPLVGITIATSAVMINVVLWAILGPPIARSIERKSREAVVAFVDNMIAMAQPPKR